MESTMLPQAKTASYISTRGPAQRALKRQAIRCGTQQRGLGVEDDMHRHLREQLAEAALVAKRLEKSRVVERRANARRDAAAEVNAAGSKYLQRQVPGLASQNRDKRGERQGRQLAGLRFSQ